MRFTNFYGTLLAALLATTGGWLVWQRSQAEAARPVSSSASLAATSSSVAGEKKSSRPATEPVATTVAFERDPNTGHIQLCQCCDNSCFSGVSCNDGFNGCEPQWNARHPLPWGIYAQGEYIGPARDAHVPVYRLRPNDQIQLIYRVTRNRTDKPYKLNVGDLIRIESINDPGIDREVEILQDGNIMLKLLSEIPAAGKTIPELREVLEKEYRKFINNPAITITPSRINTKLEDLRAAIKVSFGTLAQGTIVTVAPDGSVSLPALGSVYVQGMTLDEVKREVEERYRVDVVEGMEITPSLLLRAPTFVYVLGEVRQPGQFTMPKTTTAMQAIALAGGWNVGGNLRQIVVFRRTDDWRLMATKLDLNGALQGERPCPADDIFLRDLDIVLVPKSPILRTDDWISLIFTRGLYSALPGFATAYSTGASQL